MTGAVGDVATFPSVLNTFPQNTDGEFSIIFDVFFGDDNYNIFFGGHSGLSYFHLIRNMNAGNIDLVLIDGNDAHRDYTWSPQLVRGRWYNIILNGIANADDGIDLYVDFVKKTVAAQQNDVGYSATASFALSFGDHDGTHFGKMNVAKPYFYNRKLTANEITDIKRLRKYPTDYAYAWDMKRPNIGLNKAITIS